MRVSTALGVATALAGGLVQAIPTVSSKGSKFFTSDGNQFFVKGIAYQLSPDDPLVNGTQCQLDASLMKTLGANAIRVYHVDPHADHTACMTAFANIGVYLFVDLDTFNTAIDQNNPHWNQTQSNAFNAVMDEFQKFDNTAGFFIGNEIITMSNGSLAAPFIKSATRDVKSYRQSKNYRNIPIGYSAADIAQLRPMLQNYLVCGDSNDAIDFFSLNSYEWCGDSSFMQSGYSQLTANITDFPVPIFFSETGCNTVPPRTFSDQTAIFGPQMSPYWSGSIIYEWVEAANNYGLINYGAKVDPSSPNAPPDGFPIQGVPTPIQPDFSNLSEQWKTVSPSAISMAAYSPTLTAPPCPAFTSGVWEVNGNVALPTLGQTFDAGVASSIMTGGPAPSSSSTTTAKKGAATPAMEVNSMGISLAGVVIAVLGLM